MSGQLVAVVGPSGAGKDTLIRAALRLDPALHWARRAITRPAAPSEPFESLTEAEFADRLAAGQFALHWRAHGLGYGVPLSELEGLAAGRTVLFNGSRAALAEAGARFPGLVVLLITAPAALLAARLAARGRESAPEIAARIARAGFPLPAGITPRVVVNDASPEAGARRLIAALQPVRA